MKKIAVIFPGIGYTKDKPLLYYGSKILRQQGYEVIPVNYESVHSETLMNCIKNSDRIGERVLKENMVSFLAEAIRSVEKQLEQVELQNYGRVAILCKSIGAVVGNAYMKKHGIVPLNLLITPLEQCFQFYAGGDGIVFAGDTDPLANAERVKNECKRHELNCCIFQKANHSLESENISLNVKYLSEYVERLTDTIVEVDSSVYDYAVTGRNGDTVELSDYRGQVLLIVNTATGCGFTPQYEQLEKIYSEYSKEGFSVLDFPCNQFNRQAPGTSDEIHAFCMARYDIHFPQFAKIHVNGSDAIDLYRYLKRRRGFRGFDTSTPDGTFLERKVREEDPDYMNNDEIKWNFTKFLIDREGRVFRRYEPSDLMEDIRKDVETLLKK